MPCAAQQASAKTEPASGMLQQASSHEVSTETQQAAAKAEQTSGKAAQQAPAAAAPATAPAEKPPDRTLYVVATAHLDTQWLWTIQDSINEYVPATLRGNFALFEKFPNYVFSFEGAFRYRLAEEYYPDDFAKLREHIKAGRWRVCGSFVDACDVNVPSPESLIRQILYGNGYFEKEFGKTSCDVFLPDCFGFGFALPSVAAHCGLKGFSTQKLTWGSSVGTPFDVGLWEGVDGSTIIAALNPGDYVAEIREDLSTAPNWIKAIDKLGQPSGVFVGYKYFGVGDRGGAPDDESVSRLEQAIAADGPIHVRSAGADQLYRDLTPEQAAKLPRYKGELLMTRHGVGCYTSQAAMKRWNRQNEQLADAAERAAVLADWLGGLPYPREKLAGAWCRFLWHQFHDDLTGTSIPQAYTFSWNDEILSLNESAGILADAVGAVARAMDTQTEGAPLVIYNPLSVAREDVVEATVRFDAETPPEFVRVFDDRGEETPCEVVAAGDDEVSLVFLARVPSVGFVVYEARPSDEPCRLSTGLAVTDSSLENERYRVEVNADGDVARIHDKAADKELLSGPTRLQLLNDTPDNWPEWEIRYEDVTAPPRANVGGPVRTRIVERGPARVSLEISRQAEGSTFVQTIRLAAGGGVRGKSGSDAGGNRSEDAIGGAADRVEFDTRLDWRTPKAALKAAFPLSVSNPMATYDLGLGTIQRGNNHEKLYEVPAQQWADLTAADGHYGVAILNDCKYGWDKPSDDVLRLTLVHSPHLVQKDFGHHRFLYAVCGHEGDWRDGGVCWQASCVNQPLRAFQTARHAGQFGRRYSLLSVSTPQVAVRALKKAEASNAVVVRLQELHGRPAEHVRVTLAPPIVSAMELTGAEQPLAGLQKDAAPTDSESVGSTGKQAAQGADAGEPAPHAAESAARSPSQAAQEAVSVEKGSVVTSLRPNQPRTVAVTFGSSPVKLSPPAYRPIPLPFDADVISMNGEKSETGFDGRGHCLPGELLSSRRIEHGGVVFDLGPITANDENAMTCQGQVVELPSGNSDRLYLLAAARGGDVDEAFGVGGYTTRLLIQDWTGFVGQSQSLVTEGKVVDASRMAEPFIKPAEVAWVGTHRHDAEGRNEPYVFSYLFAYPIQLPKYARTFTFPNNPAICVLALTIATHPNDAILPAAPLYDRIIAPKISPAGGLAIEPIDVVIELGTEAAGAGAWAIRYTLDGTEPGPQSALYEGPFKLTKSATVKARVFEQGRGQDYVACRSYAFVKPRPPDAPKNVVVGLDYRYYEGSWRALPDFGSLTPAASGQTETHELKPKARNDNFALVFEGYVEAPRNGVYTFCTESDDGSRLSVGGAVVVDNDGSHGKQERSGAVALGAGKHAIKVEYFQRGGDSVLEVAWEGPELPRQPIPANALFRANARP